MLAKHESLCPLPAPQKSVRVCAKKQTRGILASNLRDIDCVMYMHVCRRLVLHPSSQWTDGVSSQRFLFLFNNNTGTGMLRSIRDLRAEHVPMLREVQTVRATLHHRSRRGATKHPAFFCFVVGAADTRIAQMSLCVLRVRSAQCLVLIVCAWCLVLSMCVLCVVCFVCA